MSWLPVLALLSQVPATAGPSGRVVRMVGSDTMPAAGSMVVLHRVTDSLQGPIDSMRSASDGTFRFGQPADTTGVLLVSARWSEIEYFAPPVNGEAITVVVSDTSSGVPVHLVARHLIIGGPAADGTRDVVDLLVLRNESALTRVSADSASPTAWFLVPSMAANLHLGDADFALDAFDRHADTLLLYAPIPPGDRQFFLQYQIAPRTPRFVVPLQPAPDTMTVLAEEADLDVGAGLTRTDVQEVEGRRFFRWVGSRPASTMIELRLPGSGTAPAWLLVALVGALAAGLLAALVRALKPARM